MCVCNYDQVSFPPDKSFEIIKWTQVPAEPVLEGARFQSEKQICDKTVAYGFHVIRVHGSVQWEDLGDVSSELEFRLNHWDNKADKVVDTLELGKFASGSDDVTTGTFDSEFSSSHSFWLPGDEGHVMSCCVSACAFDWLRSK